MFRLLRLQSLRRATSSYSTTATAGPPVYDAKPQWWARWAYGLLAMDVILTTSACELIVNKWTHKVETKKGKDASPTPDAATNGEEWVLRPLWQRLGLATGQIFVGAAVGAAILALRDRTVWRMRLVQVMKSAQSMSTTKPSQIRTKQVPERWVEVETASGRRNQYMWRDCDLAPGRDETELFLRIAGIKGEFWLGLNKAKVLGETGLAPLALRSKLVAAWDGDSGRPVQSGGWVHGPVVREGQNSR